MPTTESTAGPELQPVDIVLGGGGVRGIGLVGALSVLDEAGFRFVRVMGTSAGSVVGAFLAALTQAGEPVSQLLELMDLFSERRVADRWPLGHIPLLGEPLSLLLNRSLYQGRYLRDFVTGTLADLGVHTFADLRLAGDDPDPPAGPGPAAAPTRYRLAVTVTDLTLRRESVLPWDLEEYGTDPDAMAVADAVIASSAIPFVFPPVRIPGPSGPSVMVDGGVTDDLPIGTLDAATPRPPSRPVLAVSLGGLVPARGGAPRDLLSESIALAETIVAGGEARHIAEPCTARRIITVDSASVSPIDFDLSARQKAELLESGRSAARAFLRTWDFGGWLARCGDQMAAPA